MRKLLFPSILITLVLLSGCSGTFEPTIKFNEDGAGTVFIEMLSSSEIDSEIRDMVKDKKNVKIDKSKVDDEYKYDISFDFDDILEVSENASLDIDDRFDKIIYTYSDEISAETFTGKKENFLDFKYCIKLPGKVIKLMANNINDTTYNGQRTACVTVEGGKDDLPTVIQLISEKQKEGCEYNNPRCRSVEDCINNQCILKQGCDYDNPTCEEGFECIDNQCNEKMNLGFVLIGLGFVLVVIGLVAIAGYFLITHYKKKKASKSGGSS